MVLVFPLIYHYDDYMMISSIIHSDYLVLCSEFAHFLSSTTSGYKVISWFVCLVIEVMELRCCIHVICLTALNLLKISVLGSFFWASVSDIYMRYISEKTFVVFCSQNVCDLFSCVSWIVKNNSVVCLERINVSAMLVLAQFIMELLSDILFLDFYRP